MTCLPVLFKGEMVRAVIDGTKTQTRRIVKLPQPTALGDLAIMDRNTRGEWGAYTQGLSLIAKTPCPYGAPGGQLWVRETWQAHPRYFGTKPRDIPEGEPVVFRATHDGPPGAWRPSIFLPRWASRIRLDVLAVRVERLQDISEEDARAEGVTPSPSQNVTDAGWARFRFENLWDAINRKRSPWAADPWVWVVTFRVAS